MTTESTPVSDTPAPEERKPVDLKKLHEAHTKLNLMRMVAYAKMNQAEGDYDDAVNAYNLIGEEIAQEMRYRLKQGLPLE